jgi:TRAP-type transport system small permease protein
MFGKIVRWINQALLAVGAATLAVMMFLTAADVAGRYLLNRPISGALEGVEFLMAVLIPFSIAYCAYQRAHVSVELIMGRFSMRVQRVVDSLMTLLTILFLGALCWQNLLYINEIRVSQMTSAVLLIPAWPFVIPTAVGAGVFVLNTALHLFGIKNERTAS